MTEGWDWGSLADWVAAGANVVVAYLAWKALRTWRDEALGKRNIEIAEDIVRRMRDLSRRFRKARHGSILPIRQIDGYDAADRSRDAQGVAEKLDAMKADAEVLEAHRLVLAQRFGQEADAIVRDFLLLYYRASTLATALRMPLDGPLPAETHGEDLVFGQPGDEVEREIDGLVQRAIAVFGRYLAK